MVRLTTLSVKISPDTKDRLEELAKAHNLTPSEAARNIIELCLQSPVCMAHIFPNNQI